MKINRQQALQSGWFARVCRVMPGVVVGLAWLGVAVPAPAQTTGSTGGSQQISNYKPTLGIEYGICYQGVFPARDTPYPGPADRTDPMIGEIRVFSFGFVPGGFMSCSGQTLSISQYIPLFYVISNRFGGDGVTTFQLPNLQGRVPIGAGQGPGLPNYTLGQRDGQAVLALSATNLPAHAHTIPGGKTGLTGTGAPFDNLQPSLGLNYLIDGNSELVLFAGNFTPTYWAYCDGSLLPISSFPTLYGLIGTNYGGDGVTTFALPDLRGRSPVGAGQSQGYVYIPTVYSLAQAAGAPTVTLTSAMLPAHTHTIPGGNTGSTGSNAPSAWDNRQPVLGMTWLIADNANLPSSSSPASFPVCGEMRVVAGNSAALGNGWLAANGATLRISQNPYLFSEVGTSYGGDGVTTFQLPDLSGRMGGDVGFDGSGGYLEQGEVLGQESVTLNSSLMPAHTHQLPAPPLLTGQQLLTNGAFQFAFTNIPGLSFSVVTSTNPALPLSNWVVAATLSNNAPGLLQFTAPPTNEAQRYYQVRMP